MIITEEILSKFKNKLNVINESLPLSNGTKSAKIVCHVDLDGLISGITMVHQLVKQGIPKERIKVEFAQYGDEDKEGHKHTEKFIGKKHEFVGVTDFAKLPKSKPYALITDITGSKQDPSKVVNFIRSNKIKDMSLDQFKKVFSSNFKVDDEKNIPALHEALKSLSSLNSKAGVYVAKSYQIFKNMLKNNSKNDALLRSEFKNFLIKNNFEKSSETEIISKIKASFNNFDESDSGKLKKLCHNIKEYYELWNKIRLTPESIVNLNIQVVDPDFVSDHHSNETGSLSSGKSGEIAVSSPSEAEHLSKTYAPGFWPAKDLKAVSMVDSAGYDLKQLENTIFLEKHFKGADKEKNLATILATIYDAMIKKDREAGKWVIKNAGTNLVSAYTTTLKAAGYSGKRLEYLNALKEGNVSKAKQLLSEIPDILNKGYDRHNEPKDKIMSREDWIEKNKKDMEQARTGGRDKEEEKEHKRRVYKFEQAQSKGDPGRDRIFRGHEEVTSRNGKMRIENNFTIFNGTDWETQYPRYATSLYSVNGKRSPFTMRYWNGFFQVSKNTLYKGKVNFADVNDHVLKDIDNFLRKEGMDSERVNDIIQNMKEKNGGHDIAIWSFQGFDQIKPTKEEEKKLNMKKYELANKMSKKEDDYKSLRGREIKKGYWGWGAPMKKYSMLKTKCMEYAMDSAIKWTNKLYPVDKSKLGPLENNNKTFEGKK